MTTTEIISYFRDLMDNERESSKGYTRSEYNQMEYFLRDAERRQKTVNGERHPVVLPWTFKFSTSGNVYTFNFSFSLIFFSSYTFLIFKTIFTF